ncbi:MULTISPECIES: helix-turn-helix domain-containing protein [unclassified Microbacterium]|uniref:helix-turn-helix domain-containing protein n=1 Tax=unclassified Microbacterium TaxID=2609290 RepID=UPI0037CB5CFE
MRRYEAGESARSLAEKHGVSASAVTNLLRDNAVVVKKRIVTDAEARRMAREYDSGATIRELQTKHELSQGAVARALHRVGVNMRPRAPRRKA